MEAKKFTSIKISEYTKALLKKIKKQRRKKNLDDVILFLIQCFENQSQNQAQSQNQNEDSNPYVYAQNHPCPYRTLIKTENDFVVLCAETRRIPLLACVTRQKRYVEFNRKCKPIGREKVKPKPSKPMKTRVYRDDFESDYYPINDDYFKDDWGDYI